MTMLVYLVAIRSAAATFGKDRLVAQEHQGIYAPVTLITTTYEVPSEIGGKRISTLARGSGFLISPCYVATVRHILFGDGQPPPQSPVEIEKAKRRVLKVQVGQPAAASSTLTDTYMATPVMWGSDTGANRESDWALLKVQGSSCPGELVGWFDTDNIDEIGGFPHQLSVAGFPGHKPTSSLWVDRDCTSYSPVRQQKLQEDQCTTGPGMSGGPVYYLRNGLPVAAGIIVGEPHGQTGSYYDWSSDKYNLSLSLSALLYNPGVETWLAQDRERVANPLVSLPSVQALDKRRAVLGRRPEYKIFAPIGKVGSSGTAFMVSPCYALTSYAAVFGNKNIAMGARTSPSSVKVKFGYVSTAPLESFDMQPVRWGSNKRPRVNEPFEDWALLHSAACPGRTYGWFELNAVSFRTADDGSQKPRQRDRFSIGGFPVVKSDTSIWVDVLCASPIGTFNSMTWDHCSVTPGLSGAPIFRAVDDVPQAVGLVSRAGTGAIDSTATDSRSAKIYVPIEDIFLDKRVPELIKDDQAGAQNPARGPWVQ